MTNDDIAVDVGDANGRGGGSAEDDDVRWGWQWWWWWWRQIRWWWRRLDIDNDDDDDDDGDVNFSFLYILLHIKTVRFLTFSKSILNRCVPQSVIAFAKSLSTSVSSVGNGLPQVHNSILSRALYTHDFPWQPGYIHNCIHCCDIHCISLYEWAAFVMTCNIYWVSLDSKHIGNVTIGKLSLLYQ